MIRKAKIGDIKEIHRLINYWAGQGKLLGRPLNYLYENLRDFWVFSEGKKIVGCCALHIVGWQDLGEVKSLAVNKHDQGKGIGEKLVKRCLKEAKRIGIKSVFALTFTPQFFKKLGFREIKMKKLPHKIWSDCLNCSYFPDCDEEGVIIRVK